MKINFARSGMILLGLIVASLIFIAIWGNTSDIKTRMLLTAYALAGSSIAGLGAVLLYNRERIFLSMLAVLLLAVCYCIILYCIWLNPGFYAHNWKWINSMILATVLFPLLAVLLLKLFVKK